MKSILYEIIIPSSTVGIYTYLYIDRMIRTCSSVLFLRLCETSSHWTWPRTQEYHNWNARVYDGCIYNGNNNKNNINNVIIIIFIFLRRHGFLETSRGNILTLTHTHTVPVFIHRFHCSNYVDDIYIIES